MDNPSNSSAIAHAIPIVLFDGGFKENQGQGAAAAVLLMPNGRRYTVSHLLSFATQEETEYQGLIIGLQKAQRLGIRQLEVKGNSDTVFNQINQLTAVTDDRLKPLYLEARRLMKEFDRIALEWIPGDQNRSAKKAVERCIEEALGRDVSGAISTPSNPLIPKIAQLLSLGNQVTDRDFLELVANEDDLMAQSLDGLRSQISTSVQDAIALQWDGDDGDLAEMYRWYLRGLPPEAASRKVRLDRQAEAVPLEKLPWEEALISPFAPDLSQISPTEVFAELALENFSDDNVSTNPLTPFYSPTSDTAASQSDGAGDGIFADFSRELQGDPGGFEPWLGDVDLPLAASAPEDGFTLSGVNDRLTAEVEIPRFGEPDGDREAERHLGVFGLPSDLLGEEDGHLIPSLAGILEQIQSLPVNHKKALARALAKQPDLVNWILQAIVDRVASQTPP